MIARFVVLLPCSLIVPKGEIFDCPRIVADGCEVRFHPPCVSDREPPEDRPDELWIDNIEGYVADVLHIDFVQEQFDRRVETDLDPSIEFITEVVNRFISRLRFVTQAPELRPIDLGRCSWRIHYLTDQGEEFDVEKGLVRGRGARLFQYSMVVADKAIWSGVGELGVDYEPPEWNGILLDAYGALPHVGSAVVLAATALEVFIAATLDTLADRSVIPNRLWNWIVDRGDAAKNPSVADQFDVLLEVLHGRSLKENEELWERFMKIRRARNSFVHSGVAVSGRRSKAKPLSANDARECVDTARDVIEYVESDLPVDLQRPKFNREREITFRQRIPTAEE